MGQVPFVSLGHVGSLKYLDLSNNRIAKIEDPFFQVRKLNFLKKTTCLDDDQMTPICISLAGSPPPGHPAAARERHRGADARRLPQLRVHQPHQPRGKPHPRPPVRRLRRHAHPRPRPLQLLHLGPLTRGAKTTDHDLIPRCCVVSLLVHAT